MCKASEEKSSTPTPTGTKTYVCAAIACGATVVTLGTTIATAYLYAAEAAKPTLFTDANVNPCLGAKPKHANPRAKDYYFSNDECMVDNVVQVLEQAGANVTKGYKGLLNTGDRKPITTSYKEAGLCPVNVHWHAGAEHYSHGEFDDKGSGPSYYGSGHRQLLHDTYSPPPAPPAYPTYDLLSKSKAVGTDLHDVRLGFRCHHYKPNDPKFTTPYEWKHCKHMEVGETYEIHWPHSAAGDCGTRHQYQTPFYDGVFCNGGIISLNPLNTFEKIGVQSQVFTIVNDEKYFVNDLIKGAIEGDGKWEDVAKYTGSTTGTSRNNEVCSKYTPITWQVDRKCHIVSASSFDKLCKDMKMQSDDMTDDLHAHGSRTLVADRLAANNHVRD